jgi:hypothetical protein
MIKPRRISDTHCLALFVADFSNCDEKRDCCRNVHTGREKNEIHCHLSILLRSLTKNGRGRSWEAHDVLTHRRYIRASKLLDRQEGRKVLSAAESYTRATSCLSTDRSPETSFRSPPDETSGQKEILKLKCVAHGRFIAPIDHTPLRREVGIGFRSRHYARLGWVFISL